MPCRLLEALGNASDLQVTTAFLVLHHIFGWKGDIERIKTELRHDPEVLSTLGWK